MEETTAEQFDQLKEKVEEILEAKGLSATDLVALVQEAAQELEIPWEGALPLVRFVVIELFYRLG